MIHLVLIHINDLPGRVSQLSGITARVRQTRRRFLPLARRMQFRGHNSSGTQPQGKKGSNGDIIAENDQPQGAGCRPEDDLVSRTGRQRRCELFINSSRRMHLHHYTFVARQFADLAEVVDVQEFGNGNINDTYLVSTDAESLEDKYFVLQRINTLVFKHPRLIMQNIRVFTDHMRRRAREEGHHWEIPRVIPTGTGQDLYLDPEGNFWRAISFVHGTRSFDTIRDTRLAREVGYALGTFQYLISDLPVHLLADTLEGFHIMPRYLRSFDQTFSQKGHRVSAEVNYCLRFVEQRRAFAPVLENARDHGELPLRPVHGDPKVNNVMIEESTGHAISLVDLDTVKPGLIHYDIGDCMRSGCNPLGEETERWEAVQFDPDIGAAILEGYLNQARNFLTPTECEYLYDSIRLLSFELGVRFFTDYLAGNVYFKVKHPEHNLQRALVQFKLTESVEAHEADIRHIIESMVSPAA
jgi:Ser/Thr protein kinase RdoA (MazF antagonist)